MPTNANQRGDGNYDWTCESVEKINIKETK